MSDVIEGKKSGGLSYWFQNNAKDLGIAFGGSTAMALSDAAVSVAGNAVSGGGLFALDAFALYVNGRADNHRVFNNPHTGFPGKLFNGAVVTPTVWAANIYLTLRLLQMCFTGVPVAAQTVALAGLARVHRDFPGVKQLRGAIGEKIFGSKNEPTPEF